MKLKDLLPIIEHYTMVRITDDTFNLDHVSYGIDKNLLDLFGEENVICIDGYVEHVGAIRVKIENTNNISYKRYLEPGTLFTSK